MAVSKVIYGNQTLIDLTPDTIKADKLLSGYTAHGADGEQIIGTCDFDANTQDATAKQDEILAGKTAYNKGVKLTGTMKDNGGVSGVISKRDAIYNVAQGYHDGSGKVSIPDNERGKIIPENIRSGVTILGIEGSMSGTEGARPQAKTVTPTTTEQEILPDTGYNYLSQVTVLAIPYHESDNSAGGKTVTIG